MYENAMFRKCSKSGNDVGLHTIYSQGNPKRANVSKSVKDINVANLIGCGDAGSQDDSVMNHRQVLAEDAQACLSLYDWACQ